MIIGGGGKERKRKKGGEVLAKERRGDAANQIYTRERAITRFREKLALVCPS